MQRRNAVNQGNQPTQTQEIPNWVDWVILLVVVAVSAASVLYTVGVGALNVSVAADTQASWHLVRSAGLVAYTLLAASTLWGLFLSSKVLKSWSPGPLTLLLHATTSWLAVVLAAAHALLLLFDNFYNYTLPDLLIPFIGPYRPFAVGLGVIALWLTLAITVSFSLRKLMSRKAWLWLHYTSYIAFALVTVHGLLAGSDAMQTGFRIILIGFAAGVFALLAWRISQNAASH
ncbi:MAG TPA: hypothetical protein VMT34_10975 [Aggregatilineales bacterium]|nr:hypothetical protein [Aggregatilineales bacterium]